MWNVNPKWGFPYIVLAARFTNKLVILYGLLSQEGLISHRRINTRRQRPLFRHFVSILLFFLDDPSRRLTDTTLKDLMNQSL